MLFPSNNSFGWGLVSQSSLQVALVKEIMCLHFMRALLSVGVTGLAASLRALASVSRGCKPRRRQVMALHHQKQLV
jgi:hypothetical protein